MILYVESLHSDVIAAPFLSIRSTNTIVRASVTEDVKQTPPLLFIDKTAATANIKRIKQHRLRFDPFPELFQRDAFLYFPLGVREDRHVFTKVFS